MYWPLWVIIHRHATPTAKISCIYGIYVHRLVIEGVVTIVYAFIVRTYTAFKSSAGQNW